MANADITIGLEMGGGDSSSTQYLKATLDKLTAAIEKLSSNASIAAAKGGDFSGKNYSNANPFQSVSDGMNKGADEFNRAGAQAMRELGTKIGTVLATSVGVALTAGFARYFNNQANAIMGRASAAGQFVSNAVAGNANSSFGDYINSLYQTEKARQLANTNNLYEAGYGTAGSVLGLGLGVLAGGIKGAVQGKNPFSAAAGAIHGAGKGALSGGVIGAAYGKEQAALANAPTEIKMQYYGAMTKRAAEASTSEWQTSFSRWGLPTSQYLLAGTNLSGTANPITASLSTEFENRYKNSQNYNAILNGIVPYLNHSPLDTKNGDLDKVANQLLRAGVSADQFSKFTLQSAQYQAIAGKQIGDFADTLQNAQHVFGKGFTLDTLQSSLNFLMLGYNKDEAIRLAYNSQLNPGVMSSVQSFANSSIGDFYARKALSKSVGLDLNRSMANGELIGLNGKPISSAQFNKIKSLRDNYISGKTDYPTYFTKLMAGNISPAMLDSWIQGRVEENDSINKYGLGGGKNDAQNNARKIITQYSDASKVENMMVNATNVTILNQSSGLIAHPKDMTVQNNINEGGVMIQAPSQYGSNTTPAKK